MKFKTIASTFFLSSFLVGGLATEAEALTLPEPTTYTYTVSEWGNTVTGELLENAVECEITINGFYGIIPSENLGYRQWGDNRDDILVLAEGSTIQLKLTSDYPEMMRNDLLDPNIINSSIWEPGYYNTDNMIDSNAYSVTKFFVQPDVFDGEFDTVPAIWYLDSELSNIIECHVTGHPLVGLLYTVEQTGENQFTYTPTMNNAILHFQNYNSDEGDKSHFILTLANILVINQEGIDELVETGSTSFSSLTKGEWHEDFAQAFDYPGLLELLGGESSEPTTPSTPESTSPVYASWAEPQVTFAEENNLIVDSLGNDYTKSITRTQIADLLVNMIEQHTGITMAEASADTFTDSTSEAVLKAFDAGIISGKGEGIFDPEATATRQEIAIMIVNAIKVLEENTGESFVDHNLTSLDGYADFDTTADWAQNHVAILANNGIMSGSDGYLTPLSDTSIQGCLVLNNNLFKLD